MVIKLHIKEQDKLFVTYTLNPNLSNTICFALKMSLGEFVGSKSLSNLKIIYLLSLKTIVLWLLIVTLATANANQDYLSLSLNQMCHKSKEQQICREEVSETQKKPYQKTLFFSLLFLVTLFFCHVVERN